MGTSKRKAKLRGSTGVAQVEALKSPNVNLRPEIDAGVQRDLDLSRKLGSAINFVLAKEGAISARVALTVLANAAADVILSGAQTYQQQQGSVNFMAEQVAAALEAKLAAMPKAGNA